MNRIIRFLFFIVNIFILICCSKDKDVTPLSIKGTWKVESYQDLVTNSSIVKTNENSWDGMDVILTFDDSSKPYEIRGKNTSNYINGVFTYVNNGEINISHLTTSYADEPEWGFLFTRAYLKGLKEFVIIDNKLTIFYDNKTKCIIFVKEN